MTTTRNRKNAKKVASPTAFSENSQENACRGVSGGAELRMRRKAAAELTASEMAQFPRGENGEIAGKGDGRRRSIFFFFLAMREGTLNLIDRRVRERWLLAGPNDENTLG